MSNLKPVQFSPLQIASWLLIGGLLFLPLLPLPTQSLGGELLRNFIGLVQLLCLAGLIAVQYRMRMYSRSILVAFVMASIVLAGFWVNQL